MSPPPASAIDTLPRTRAASQRFDLHQTVIERRCAPHIGERAAGELVGILAVTGQLLPPHREAHHDAAPCPVGDPGAQFEAAASIEYPHVISGNPSPRRRVIRMNTEPGLALGGAQALYVDEGTVQEMPSRRRDHRQG